MKKILLTILLIFLSATSARAEENGLDAEQDASLAGIKSVAVLANEDHSPEKAGYTSTLEKDIIKRLTKAGLVATPFREVKSHVDALVKINLETFDFGLKQGRVSNEDVLVMQNVRLERALTTKLLTGTWSRHGRDVGSVEAARDKIDLMIEQLVNAWMVANANAKKP